MIEIAPPDIALLAAGVVLGAYLGYTRGESKGYARGWIEREEDHGPRYPLEIAREADRRQARGETLDQLKHLDHIDEEEGSA